jgi:hypothetical protein
MFRAPTVQSAPVASRTAISLRSRWTIHTGMAATGEVLTHSAHQLPDAVGGRKNLDRQVRRALCKARPSKSSYSILAHEDDVGAAHSAVVEAESSIAGVNAAQASLVDEAVRSVLRFRPRFYTWVISIVVARVPPAAVNSCRNREHLTLSRLRTASVTSATLYPDFSRPTAAFLTQISVTTP